MMGLTGFTTTYEEKLSTYNRQFKHLQYRMFSEADRDR